MFTSILADAITVAEKFDLDPIAVPHQRKPPLRFAGTATAHCASSIKQNECLHLRCAEGV